MSLLGARRPKLSQRDAGFTLVELVVAMLVIAIVILAIMTIQAKALTTNADSAAREQATAYANESMEQLRAIPWNVLKRGLANSYLAEDPAQPVASGKLTIPGRDPYTLIVAPSGANEQDLDAPWPPLFDGSGSNSHVETDVSGNGAEFLVRTYVTQDLTGAEGAVGLLVVVDWAKRSTGASNLVVLESTAFAPSGGCGDTSTAPFLASCQAVFDAAATTGNVVVSASAELDDGADAPLVPGGGSIYSLVMSTASQYAHAGTHQVSVMDSSVRYGGVVLDDVDPTTDPATILGWTTGFEHWDARATDDESSAATPPTSASTPSSSLGSTLSAAGTNGWVISGRTDSSRTGRAFAQASGGCATGGFDITNISSQPRPCAEGSLGATAIAAPALVKLGLGGAGDELTLTEVEMGASTAWAAHFPPSVAGNATTGCTTSSGAGCSAAGATQAISKLVVGAMSGGWVDGAAASGLVVVIGYSDTTSVPRGTSDDDKNPHTRVADIQYWNGTDYSIAAADESATGSYDIATVNYDKDGVVIVGSGKLVVGNASPTLTGTSPCQTSACEGSVANGSIVISMKYVITVDGSVYTLAVSTAINGTQAAASFKAAPDAT